MDTKKAQKIPVLETEHICKEGEGVHTVKESEGGAPNVILIASGAMVHNAIEAAEKLESEDIPTRVLNVFDIASTYNNYTLDELLTPRTGIVTVHDGARSVLRDIVNHRLHVAGMSNSVTSLGILGYGVSGKKDALYTHYGLDAESIAETAREIRRKQSERS